MHTHAPRRALLPGMLVVLAVMSTPTLPAGADTSPITQTTLVWASGRGGVTSIFPNIGLPSGSAIPGSVDGPSAISPDGSTLWVADYATSTVTPYDTASRSPGAPIPVAEFPSAIAIAPDGFTVYVANEVNRSVTPIDVATRTAGTPIEVGGEIEGLAISPSGKTLYVAQMGGLSGSVAAVDLASRTVRKQIRITSGAPSSLAVTPNGKVLYVGVVGPTENYDGSNVVPVDTATGTAGTPIPVGPYPGAIAVTPDGSKVYVACYYGDIVHVISTKTNTVTKNVYISPLMLPSDIAITPDGRTAFVSGAFFDQKSSYIERINTSTQTLKLPAIPYIQVGAISITPDQAPVAALAVQARRHGTASSFSAAGSRAISSGIKSYRWDFGDGHSRTTLVPYASHTYVAAGEYTASVTLTDAAGTSTTVVFTGQSVSRNGSSAARAAQTFAVT